MSKNLVNKLTETLDSGILLEYVDNSLAVVQVLTKLGYSNKGQYVTIVKEFLISNDIDISHFTINGKPSIVKIAKVCPVCNSKFHTERRDNREQVTCSRACSNTYFRTKEGALSSYRNRAIKYYGSICNRCGYAENILALDVHHIDRDRNNNHITNLEVLCSNCHSIEHRT